MRNQKRADLKGEIVVEEGIEEGMMKGYLFGWRVCPCPGWYLFNIPDMLVGKRDIEMPLCNPLDGFQKAKHIEHGWFGNDTR